ncbi:alpha/beta hydrolase [Lactobacillus xylocopicola]|uniref:Esterase n=1 Tax=Lactobacillus xylocopicola TaxID=2976676 RepID=A0ABN6SI66_9LACO|nr:alpha/beta hydrolase [Lactobacillus xylocopicola]BDR60010.1 esterase [Lactobacillus xylocopicola]
MIKISNAIIYDEQRQLAVDVYAPAQATGKILLFWHGGGWIRGDKSNLTDLCTSCAEQGLTVFAPNYRLAPENLFPAAHQDSVNFVEWLLQSDYLKQNSTSPSAIIQIGASSGGVLALYLAGRYGFPTVTWSAPVNYSSWIKDHQEVKAAVDAQSELGLTDPRAISDSFYKYFTLTYIGANNQQRLPELDAKAYNYQNLHRLMMINSTNELSPTDYLLDFINMLAQKDHGVDLKLLPGTRHAMAYADEYLNESVAYLTQK